MPAGKRQRMEHCMPYYVHNCIFMRLSCSIQSIEKTSCWPLPVASAFTSCFCNFYEFLNSTLFRCVVLRSNISGKAGQSGSSCHNVGLLNQTVSLFWSWLTRSIVCVPHQKLLLSYNLYICLMLLFPLCSAGSIFKG